MHSAQLLQEALKLAHQLGYLVRDDYFGGSGGGACQLGGQKVLFLDLWLWPDEQLQRVVDVLSHEPAAEQLTTSDQLRQMLRSRQVGNIGKAGNAGCQPPPADRGKLGDTT